MNKEKFIEQAHLYLLDELGENEKTVLENIMLENDDLRAEFDSIKILYETIEQNKPDEVDEKLLTSARYSLMRKIRSESVEPSLKEKLVQLIRNIFIGNYKLAFGGAGIFIIGLFVGYIFFVSSSADMPMITTSQPVDIDKVQNGVESGDVEISNIRIPTNITGGGEIEISFDAVKPISYKGNTDDPFIQRLLASALVTEKNPGLRLRTINTIATQLEDEKTKVDPKIKNALITALKVDSNPAVRREALNALAKFPFDEDVRDAYLFVLSNDNNSGMRVLAINALAQLKVEGNSLDEKIINVLNRKAENDESDFIRLRAASLIQEVK
jgi:hypothetical protein